MGVIISIMTRSCIFVFLHYWLLQMADSVDLSQLAEAAAVIQTFEGETPPEEQVVVTIMPKATTPQISPAQVILP